MFTNWFLKNDLFKGILLAFICFVAETRDAEARLAIVVRLKVVVAVFLVRLVRLEDLVSRQVR